MALRPVRSLLSAAAVAACALAPLAGAQAAEPITIMVGGINKIIYLPAKLAESLGYFKDEGLTVELQSQPAGVDAENQLIAGAVQAVVGFYDHTIDLQSKGKELEAIAVFCKVPGEVELVSTKAAPSFKTMADAKGKTLGVTGLGSSTDFLTRYLADRQGVASKDYTLLPVGAGNTFIAAIKQDRIQAGMTTEPTVSELLKTGEAKVLVDLRTEEGSKAALGGLYPAASLYVQNAWADSHKAEATKLAHAFARTMAWIHTHSAEDIAEKMPKDYYGADKALYVSALKASLPMYTTDGRMPAGGPETVLKVLASYKPLVKSKNIDLSKTYTNAFLDAAK
ncbi:ABC transporter substrate-binding protein [Ideonella dechloratans]|uniref:ABC transporter substrate-binding protein n=1 Tax=Ideonella dechloratans TaxID=36863 RepID=A0A643F3M7_IDEDE|nr:ABC transporter substrate-binding protein [Ideonella dechloratans]KAB0572881.1 ABC transporter substrate-binding protein [Ideonella dechloratans]UFU10749.1 ABC transporter substrate-binding protein [Ideonella dechloratans]